MPVHSLSSPTQTRAAMPWILPPKSFLQSVAQSLEQEPALSQSKLLAELLDPEQTPINSQLETCVENKLLQLVGENGYVTQEHIRFFRDKISSETDKPGFTQRFKRLLNIDRKTRLLEVFAQLESEKLSEELRICLMDNINLERAFVLLRLGANPNVLWKGGKTIPEMAIQFSSPELMRVWSNSPKANLELYGPGSVRHLMHKAVLSHSSEFLELLIKKGADVNAAVPGGITPLIIAAKYHQTRNLSFLLRAGADILAETGTGYSAWYYANEKEKAQLKYALQRSFDQEDQLFRLHTQPNPQKMSLQAEVPTEPISASLREKLGISGPGLKACIEDRAICLGLSDVQNCCLNALLFNIEQRNPNLPSLPPNHAARDAFYDAMTHKLEHIAVQLKNPEVAIENKKTALLLMSEAGEWCAARYMQDVTAAQRILCSSAEPMDEDLSCVLSTLYRLRNKIFHAEFKDLLIGSHSANAYNAIMGVVGVSLGLVRANESYLDDPFAPGINHLQMMTQFYSKYDAKAIIQAIESDIKTKKIPVGVICSLLSKYKPRFGKYAEQDAFMSLVLNPDSTLTKQAIPYLLFATGILIPRDPGLHPAVQKYGLILPSKPPALLEMVKAENRSLLIEKKADLDRQMKIAGPTPSVLQKQSISALQAEILDLVQWLTPHEQPMTLRDYGAASALLQEIVPKNREAYLKALTGTEFSIRIARKLSRQQAERLLNAVETSLDEDEILQTLNPAV